MKISTKGRYALRIMIDLAENANGEYIRLKDISARQGITLKYMEQIMPMLTKAGYVRSYRGNNGGYMLAKEPEEYTAGDIIRTTEGSLAPIACLDDVPNRCERQDQCSTLEFWEGLKKVIDQYVDEINMENGGEGTKLYSTAGTKFKKLCLQNKLNLLDASVRHLGTDINYVVLQNLYNQMKDHMDFYFDTPVDTIEKIENGYKVVCEKGSYECEKCIVSVGRSGSKWMEKVCKDLEIPTKSNRVDIGVRVELPAVIFSHLTDELYESKIVYRTEKFEDNVRTFCMNPNGIVVNENTNGIITVNGHSYEGNEKKTDNTNFALLVAKHFSEPFKDSNGYGESIARLSNMLGGGVIVQRFGDLVRGRRSTEKRIEEGLVTPTLSATPGDLSLVLPKRILDGIVEMIYALDKVAPGTANDDTLLYGVEVKFYNMEVDIDENLESCHKGLYVIGDGSGVTHSLSHASASGVYVARHIIEEA